ncbi:putative baseplate assembly protein [Haloarcula sp. 1CSR25-25]|uniref:putative baseplate assembly protein n=1 Tax=Haloarcula sp. 1CSR25-25 TaxID=2862545 RepID=UPI002893F217|nr:putative baseplate assembly protein [Haloarcula sp. 1CSR25-25]MDT3435977.1 putative baseplate assembly protein [Haloarcula sp. 1CSR25-25]
MTSDESADRSDAAPSVDGRGREAIRADAAARAPYYTGTDWDPDADGPGTTLLDLFADLASGVIERLDQVPAKHRAAFVDALGFDRLPPQSAELPLTVTVSDGAGDTVRVPGGTRATAPATETRPELAFEVTEGFEATPAPFDRLISVDPRLDHVGRHEAAIAGDGNQTLFGGPDAQAHHLYLGHTDLLTLDGETTVQVRMQSTAEAETLAALDWAYHGEIGDEDGWRAMRPDGKTAESRSPIDRTDVEQIIEDYGFELATDDDGVVDDWLVSTLLTRDDPDPTPSYVDPRRRPDVVDMYADLDRLVQDHYGDYPPETASTLSQVTLQFTIPEPFVETEVAGTESNWLRATVPADADPGLAYRFADAEIRDVTLVAGRVPGDEGDTTESDGDPDGFEPDDLLANDVPLQVPELPDSDVPAPADSDVVRPFGSFPRVQDAFYIGSAEAFTKADQRVTVAFGQTEAIAFGDDPPLVSWEYWNGAAWEYLDVDGPDRETIFADPGSVSFPVPPDLEPTTVAGHEGHWVRARLVSNYGEIEISDRGRTDQVWQRLDKVPAPRLPWITVRYQAPPSQDNGGSGNGDPVPAGLVSAAPQTMYAETNLAMSTLEPSERVRPFSPLPDESQTLYLGFDGPLEGGPLQVFAAFADVEYPGEFRPSVRWEAYTDAGWERVSVRDDTEGLTERGMIRFSLPSETVPLAQFGVTRHWLRARVTADRFVAAPYRPRLDTGDGQSGTDACGDRFPTTPPGSEAAMTLPTTDLVVHNTGLAANVRTVTDERLGSSDGTAEQTFTVASPPVREATLWVDEVATLSAGQRDALAADPDTTVELAGDQADPDAVWVEWTAVEDFLASGATDRHYTLDAVAGTVTFGDGVRGAIPPRGRDNVRVSYQTGGGAAGNVPPGAVEELDGSLAFVDGVTNHVAGDGAADAEPTAAVLERAPKALRDRNRAVAPADFERIARSSARELARTHCLPGLDPRGQYRPGWVTVLVVPRSERRKPVPSASLRAQVTEGLSAHAPAALLGDLGDERLLVRGPTYVAVAVEATVVAGPTDSLSELETTVATALSDYLHPLSGGADGDGWPFGELPCVSDCYGILEGVTDVDHVERVRLTFETPDATRTIRPGQDAPDVNPDVLIHSGDHDLDVVGGT